MKWLQQNGDLRPTVLKCGSRNTPGLYKSTVQESLSGQDRCLKLWLQDITFLSNPSPNMFSLVLIRLLRLLSKLFSWHNICLTLRPIFFLGVLRQLLKISCKPQILRKCQDLETVKIRWDSQMLIDRWRLWKFAAWDSQFLIDHSTSLKLEVYRVVKNAIFFSQEVTKCSYCKLNISNPILLMPPIVKK